MVICPQCSVEYDAGEEFCAKCGSFLLIEEEPVPEEEKPRVILICPKCQALYRKGKHCKKCGSLLVQGAPFQEASLQVPGKGLIKRWSRERMRLFNRKRELESCLGKLEAQRDKISGDVFDPLLLHYQDQLKELSFLHREIDAEVESIRKKASEEIDSLERELKPIQNRLGEFQSLFRLGAITKADFLREKNELKNEIKSRGRSLDKNRQIITLLPGKTGGSIISAESTENPLRRLTRSTALSPTS